MEAVLGFFFSPGTEQPFLLRFMSDGFEFAGITMGGNPREGSNNDAGFRLAFIMDSINCP